MERRRVHAGGRVHKGERHPVYLRVPEEHHAFYRAQATRLRISVSDYVACRIALCTGLEIPEEFFHSDPGVLRMYDPELWLEKLRAMSPPVAAKVRRELAAQWPQILEDFADLEKTGQPVRPVLLAELKTELSDMGEQLPLTG